MLWAVAFSAFGMRRDDGYGERCEAKSERYRATYIGWRLRWRFNVDEGSEIEWVIAAYCAIKFFAAENDLC